MRKICSLLVLHIGIEGIHFNIQLRNYLANLSYHLVVLFPQVITSKLLLHAGRYYDDDDDYDDNNDFAKNGDLQEQAGRSRGPRRVSKPRR